DAPAALATGGSFSAATDFPSGGFPTSIAVGDFNQDQDPDLALAVELSKASVLLGGPGGTFGPYTTFTAYHGARDVAIGDFNADGDPDLAIANNSTSGPFDTSYYVSVLLGQSGGSFGPATNYLAHHQPEGIAVGDFNGDGDPDLAVANALSNDVSVLLGGAGGSFGAASNIPTGSVPDAIAAAEFNRDGDPDLATANAGSNDVSVLLGGAGATFG